MSKSLGNFLTALESINEYSADATRLAIADAGDGMDDANFARDTANSTVLKLYTEKEWMQATLQSTDLRTGEPTRLDRAFKNELYQQVDLTAAAYEVMAFREALTKGYFELQKLRDSYREMCMQGGMGMHKETIEYFIEAQCLLLCPITPHWSETVWEMMGKEGFATTAEWPKIEKIDDVMLRSSKYLRDSMRNFRLTLLKNSKPKKGKAKKGAPAAEPAGPPKAQILVATEFEPWKRTTLEYLATIFDDATKKFPADLMKLLKTFCSTPEMKPFLKNVMQFVKFIQPDVESNGSSELALSLPFSEQDLLTDQMEYITQSLKSDGGKFESLEIVLVTDELDIPADKKKNASPGKPYLYLS